ncbi:MAG TPA: adenylate/guanylate cyclase domain-containing protein [Candidatus Limnocylindrales bacterium]
MIDRPLPAGTVTFVFTDIEGSTRLNAELGDDRWAPILARHEDLVRHAIDERGGVLVKSIGDGLFAVFEGADDAVHAAAEAQRALAAEPWPPDAPIRVRMGIHTGSGIPKDGDYRGHDVNRASRVASAGHGGQVLLSETTAALVADRPPEGVSLVSLARHRLRDLRPEQLWQLEIDGLPSSFPPITSLDSRPNNLPTQLTSFVGREAELAEATGLLETTRLLTLTGPGGTGKTRLSLQLAADVADRFPDGVWFVAMEPVRDPDLVASRIASTVGLVESANRGAREVLAEWLTDRRVLLVLDNFEQVIEAGPLVADLLRSAPDLVVVVTSRAPLRVSGEQEYGVPGLPVPLDLLAMSDLERLNLPASERGLAADAISQYEAVRLFIARAVAVRPDFHVTNENAPAVAAICARLHGMPLAIELAAARIRLLGPEAILARLERQLGVLSTGARDVPERQQTLRGAIAWSYDILAEPERRLLRRLSVFVSGCDLEAAEAICGPPEELGVDVLDGLTGLADQSLIRADTADGEPRFRLLDTIREFAFEELAASGEAAEIERRHSATYVRLVEQAAPELAGADQRRWLSRLEQEHDNIRAVLDRAVASADGSTAIRVGYAMWRYWQKRGHLNEARRRLQAIAEQPWSRRDPALRARLMEALGGVGWWQADLAVMAPSYREALELWQGLGDRPEIANALYNASFSYAVEGGDPEHSDDSGESLRLMEQARDLFQELGDEHGIAGAVWAMGNRSYFRNEGDRGVAAFGEALERFRNTGDRTMTGWALHMLGSGLIRLARFEEAEGHFREALREFHAAGDVSGIALVLDDLASIAIAADDPPRAARLWGAARAISSAGGVGLADFIDSTYEIPNRPHARSRMGSAELERYAHEGRAMSVDESVAYALSVPIEDLPGPHEHAGNTAVTGR